MGKIFCPLATNNIEVNASGHFKPCCISSKRFEVGGEIASADNYRIKDIVISEDRKRWVENFDQYYGTDCKQCYEVEKSGGESKRLREIKTWNDDYEPDVLQSIDLKMGNTCNLQCAICGPNASSKWAAFYRQRGSEKGWVNQKWPDKESFWNGLNEVAHTIKKIELSGGEPFMIKKQKILIDFLVERGLAKDIDITWFTNCTQYPEDIIARFPEFKFVRIMLSIDNTHEQFEYQRYPAKWSEAYEIFLKYKKLHDDGIIHLGISHSIGLLNIWRLPEFHAWCREHEVFIFNNLVMEPMSAKDLPLDYKLKVKEKLEANMNPDFQTNPAVGPDNWLVKFMMQDGNVDHALRWCYKNLVVSSRPELDAKVIFPELADILKEYEDLKSESDYSKYLKR
jgi:MoaA/NifB/PqqE/SkfB family radical SAM enzyme